MGDGGEGLVFRATAHLGDQEHDVALKMHTSLTLDDFERFSHRAQALSEVDHPNVMHLIEFFIGTALVDCDDSPDEAFNVMYTVADWIPDSRCLRARSNQCGVWFALGERDRTGHRLFAHLSIGRCSRGIDPPRHQALERSYHHRRTGRIDRFRDCPAPSERGSDRRSWDLSVRDAPEVVGGPGEPGPASDVWGVGALAYWVLLGEPPRLEGADTARKVLEPAAGQAGFVDPQGLSSCISELLETHPKDRPTDLARWADEFDLSVAGKRRRRLVRPLAAVLGAAIVVLAAVMTIGLYRPDPLPHAPFPMPSRPNRSRPGSLSIPPGTCRVRQPTRYEIRRK